MSILPELDMLKEVLDHIHVAASLNKKKDVATSLQLAEDKTKLLCSLFQTTLEQIQLDYLKNKDIKHHA